jgi:arsenate reductase-like glutaredoxin family protein
MRTVKVKKPNGTNYKNTYEDWTWLTTVAGKAARWLGYVPFDQIVDKRNAAPIIHRRARENLDAWADASLDIDFPDEVGPIPVSTGFVPRQPYQFVIFGEKASLEEVVLPLAERFEADLYLVTGEISDTYIYQIAKDAVADGRPLIVFTLSDADPSGWQMPVSIGRKLQAFQDLLFPTLKFELVTAALTIEQVNHLNLPESPLSPKEKRADKWRDAHGIEQTEIDALTTPERQDDLRQIINDAFIPYFDFDLERRVAKAKAKWTKAAQNAIDAAVDTDRLQAVRDRADVIRTEITDLDSELNDIAAGIELPPMRVPEASIDEDLPRQALISLDHDWIEATEALKAHRKYQDEDE